MTQKVYYISLIDIFEGTPFWQREIIFKSLEKRETEEFFNNYTNNIESEPLYKKQSLAEILKPLDGFSLENVSRIFVKFKDNNPVEFYLMQESDFEGLQD